jgi:putative mycofactocin binding protein MftB
MGPIVTGPAPGPSFDPEQPWQLDPRVALRPETFGALAYHYGTRRLAFLKSAGLVQVVKALADHESAASALAAHTSSPKQHDRYAAALAHLAGLGIISSRPGDRP